MRLWIWVCPQRERMNGFKLESASLGFNISICIASTVTKNTSVLIKSMVTELEQSTESQVFPTVKLSPFKLINRI